MHLLSPLITTFLLLSTTLALPTQPIQPLTPSPSPAYIHILTHHHPLHSGHEPLTPAQNAQLRALKVYVQPAPSGDACSELPGDAGSYIGRYWPGTGPCKCDVATMVVQLYWLGFVEEASVWREYGEEGGGGD